MYPNESTGANKGTKEDTEYAGTVIVYDLITLSAIAHFQAHAQPISALGFDPSGTLDGHNFNVFQITPQSGGIANNYRHLYVFCFNKIFVLMSAGTNCREE
jgi:hypothetical protein